MPGDDSIRFSWQAINREATASNDSCIFLKRRIYREQNCFYWYGSLLAVLVLAFLENFSLDFFGWCNFVQFSYGWPSDKLWKLWNIYESMPSNKHWSTNCRFCRSLESIQLLWFTTGGRVSTSGHGSKLGAAPPIYESNGKYVWNLSMKFDCLWKGLVNIEAHGIWWPTRRWIMQAYETCGFGCHE